jgi:hypothetical protein
MAGVLDLSKEVCKAAKSVAFEWPGVLEADDLEQEIYLYLIERPNDIEKLLNDFDDKQRLNAIKRIGHRIAAGERADYEVFSGNFKYSVDDVKRKLKWASNNGATASIRNLSMDNDLVNGMERLAEAHKPHVAAIRSRYFEGVIPTEGKDKTLLSEALTALTTQMNRSHKQQFVDNPDGPGTRKVMSRAAAISHTNREYNGDNLNWDRA